MANNSEEYVFFPGEFSRRRVLRPTPAEESEERSVPQTTWLYPWSKPKDGRIPGTTLSRFQTGPSLRKFGKGRFVRGLSTMLSPHIPDGSIPMAQVPTTVRFVDGVPGFNEIGLGRAMSFGEDLNIIRTDWGGLINQLVTGVKEAALQYIKVEEAPFRAAITPPVTKPTNYLPYIIIGGIGLILLMRKKKKK